jgi:hypothetical protein
MPKRRRSDSIAMQTEPLCEMMPTLPDKPFVSITVCL